MVFPSPLMGPTTSNEPFAMPVMEKKRKALHLSFDAAGPNNHNNNNNNFNSQQPPRKRFAVLTSPDVKKLASPALERMLLRNLDTSSGLPALLTPSTVDLLLNKQTPTEAQEKFVGEFMQKWEEVKQMHDPSFASSAYDPNNDDDNNNMIYADEATTEVNHLGDAMMNQIVPPSACASYVASDFGGITAIPVFDEADFKSYTDLSFSQVSQLSQDAAAPQPGLEATAYMEIPTVPVPPPNSVPILATKTASLALTSGGKLLNFELSYPASDAGVAPGEDSCCSSSSAAVVATKSEPMSVEDYLPTTIRSPGSQLSDDLNDDENDENNDSDEEYEPEEVKKPAAKGKGKKASKAKTGRKGNTRPIPNDLNAAERRKLERKRERNRIAATKCRQRKLQKIDELEKRIKQSKSENADLGKLVTQLKKEVAGLKSIILNHVNSGCQIVVSSDFLLSARASNSNK